VEEEKRNPLGNVKKKGCHEKRVGLDHKKTLRSTLRDSKFL
jgi:hypothetical protein